MFAVCPRLQTSGLTFPLSGVPLWANLMVPTELGGCGQKGFLATLSLAGRTWDATAPPITMEE